MPLHHDPAADRGLFETNAFKIYALQSSNRVLNLDK